MKNQCVYQQNWTSKTEPVMFEEAVISTLINCDDFILSSFYWVSFNLYLPVKNSLGLIVKSSNRLPTGWRLLVPKCRTTQFKNSFAGCLGDIVVKPVTTYVCLGAGGAGLSPGLLPACPCLSPISCLAAVAKNGRKKQLCSSSHYSDQQIIALLSYMMLWILLFPQYFCIVLLYCLCLY